MCAGLHCSSGSSPSSVWPAAEHFFVRPHSFRKFLHALPPLMFVGVSAASGAVALGVVAPVVLFFVAVFVFGDMGGPLLLAHFGGPRPRRWRSSWHRGVTLVARSPAVRARLVLALRRPNQALQRTGSVPGFTVLSRLQPVVGLAGR